jgi:hypothetical protein
LLGSLATRRMRPLWGWLASVSVLALSASLLLADEAKDDALRRNAAAAEYLARTELAVLLEPDDLVAPVRGDRAEQLGRDIDERITTQTPIDRVRIYSSLGRILYADDAGIVGTRPTYLRALTFEIANGEAAVSQIHSGKLQTLVPIWLSPSGPVAVAELSQPFGPIASTATARWYTVALACGGLVLVAAVMILVSSLAPPSVTLPRAYVRRRSSSHAPAAVLDASSPSAPAVQPSPQQRRELDQALLRIAGLERHLGRLGDQDRELETLRASLRETTARLGRTELDAGALRERLLLTQRALDEATARLQGVLPADAAAFAHDDIEIKEHGDVDELSIRRSGARSRSRTTRSSHG